MHPILLALIISLVTISPQSQFEKNEVEKLRRTPFILINGEFYRDLLTIEASKSVAKFAKKHKPEVITMSRRERLKSKKIPPRFIQLMNHTVGVYQSENEIFDFTDSRFLNPPEENKLNRPIMNIQNSIPFQVSTSPLYGKFIVKPTARTTNSPFIHLGPKKNMKLHERFSSKQKVEFLPILSYRRPTQADDPTDEHLNNENIKPFVHLG